MKYICFLRYTEEKLFLLEKGSNMAGVFSLQSLQYRYGIVAKNKGHNVSSHF